MPGTRHTARKPDNLPLSATYAKRGKNVGNTHGNLNLTKNYEKNGTVGSNNVRGAPWPAIFNSLAATADKNLASPLLISHFSKNAVFPLQSAASPAEWRKRVNRVAAEEVAIALNRSHRRVLRESA